MKFKLSGNVTFLGYLIIVCVAIQSCTSDKNNSLNQQPVRVLPFRGILQGYSHPEDEVFYNKSFWENKIAEWNKEGYNSIIWYGPGELTNGEHLLIRHIKFPEAREISKEENEKIIDQMTWLFEISDKYGLKSYLQTQPIFFTEAFSKAHGLDTISSVSPEAGHWHKQGYPNFWPGKKKNDKIYNCHIRNKLTTEYTKAVFEELLQIYPKLYGFMGYNGEPMPGDRSTFFKEAIAPALKSSKRKPLYIANQWQTPIEGFMKNITPTDIYDNTWLGFHGYNSEQITDAKPYPGAVDWSEKTKLPTVVEFYPANQLYFPFNSPKFAYEVACEMKKVPGFNGFVYWERYISGTLLGPLFRNALAHYSSTNDAYNEEPWIKKLSEKFGSHESAVHFLKAYDISNLIIPEKDALIYAGGDVMRRELRIPYDWFMEDWPWSYMTSPARGGLLIPIKQYVEFVAKHPDHFKDNNGSDPNRFPYYQETVWNSEGGSTYNITSEAHMKKIKQMGIECFNEAENAMKFVKENKEEAQHVYDIMKGYMLLSKYYEAKVLAAISASIFSKSSRDQDKKEAMELADKALESYLEFADFAHNTLDPYYIKLTGAPLSEAGVPMMELIELEKKERKELPNIFKW